MAFSSSTPNPDNLLTGGRKTRLVLDGTEVVSLDRSWGGPRMYGQVGVIAEKGGGSGNSQAFRMHKWLSGCWTVEPLSSYTIQEKVLPGPVEFVAHDTGTPAPTSSPTSSGAVLSATTVPAVKKTVWNKPQLTGVTYDAGVASSGMTLFQRVVKAVESWFAHGTVLSAPPSVQNAIPILQAPPVLVAPPLPVLPAPIPATPTQPHLPIAVADQTAEADQGFTLRWSVPGGKFNTPDAVGSFYFGGVNGGVSPQYCLSIRGNGAVHLMEYAQSTPDGSFSWYERMTFQYCKPMEVANATHEIILFPHTSPEGAKYISFLTTDSSSNQPSTGGGSFGRLNFNPIQGSFREFLYKWDPINGTLDGSPGHVTGAGKWWITERGDMRNRWHVSFLAFWPQGVLGDDPWALPLYSTPNRQFRGSIISEEPEPFSYDTTINTPRPTLAMYLRNPTTDAIVTGLTDYGPTDERSLSVSFVFAATLLRSPILWGYSISLASITQTVAPGSFTASVRNVAINGGESDTRQERASVSFDDTTNACPRLQARGEFPVRIETDVTVGGETRTVVLFRGYTQRPNGLKKGRPGRNSGLSGQGPAAAFPSPDWRHYDLECSGMWERLSRVSIRTTLALPYFRFDPSAPQDPVTNYLPGFKITDYIKYLLGEAGFPDEMIGIPDIPFRIQPGIGVNQNDFVLDPNAGVADTIFKMARNYLGMFLVFDPNAGGIVYDRVDELGAAQGAPIGQWLLVQPPPPGNAPVAHFVTSVPTSPSGATAFWNAANLPVNTVFCIGDLNGYTVAPTCNSLRVLTAHDTARGGTRIENVAVNWKSYNVPGFVVQGDPNSPHWIGYEVPCEIPDPTLYGGDGNEGLQLTQNAVDFTIRRLFDFLCLPRRIQPITAPLLFIDDPITGVLRPLRFYDRVSFNGDSDYYIRNVNPTFTRDGLQTCAYELEKMIPM